MIKAQSLIALLAIFMLVFAHAALSQRTKSDVNITYDVYFKKYHLGETSVLVNQKGKITAIDTSILIEKLPLLFKKVGIYGHRLQQNTSSPSLMDIDEVEKSLDLILRANADEFRIEIELPPHLKLIQAAPLDTNYLDLNTISEAKSRGWLDVSGNWLLTKPIESLRGTSWRGGFAVNDWHVYANGIFSTDSSALLKSWRIEKLVWEENKSRFQFGWPNISQIISGQLVGPSIFGAAISNSFTSISESTIFKELPGGVVQLNENSLIEIFKNGSLTHSFELNAGRYNVRDLEIDPTLNTIDIRITTESGRLETTSINRFAMPIQAKKNTLQYTLYVGLQANNHWNPVFGGATYQSLGSGWSIGLHHNWMSQDGFRLGIFLLKNATNYTFNLAAWWQNRKLDPQLGGTSFGISFPRSLSGISSRFSFNLYNEKALSYTSDMEASISFAPKIFNYNVGLFGVGLVREISQRQLFFMSFSNEFAILPWSNLSLNISLGLDTRNNMRAMFSLNFSPASWISQRYSQDLLNTENRQFSTQTKFAKNNTSINAGYSHRNNNFSGLRVTQNWDNDIVDLRAGVSLKELFRGSAPAQSTSLAFRTGLLFADGSFAVTSKPAETFAIVDAGQIRSKADMNVKLNGRSVGGFHKRFGLTGFTNSKQNTIEIDTSSLGYNYENRKEIITPKLGQAFFLPLKNNDAIVATGTLFFPDKHTADLLYGQLFHDDSKEDAYWYTGDDGVFSFEGKPGIWRGNVFIDDKRYRLQININESDSIEGALFLGDIVLYEIVAPTPSPLSSLPKE